MTDAFLEWDGGDFAYVSLRREGPMSCLTLEGPTDVIHGVVDVDPELRLGGVELDRAHELFGRSMIGTSALSLVETTHGYSIAILERGIDRWVQMNTSDPTFSISFGLDSRGRLVQIDIADA